MTRESDLEAALKLAGVQRDAYWAESQELRGEIERLEREALFGGPGESAIVRIATILEDGDIVDAEVADGPGDLVEAVRYLVEKVKGSAPALLYTCPNCSFVFDANFTDVDGPEYSCPVCVAGRRKDQIESLDNQIQVLRQDNRRLADLHAGMYAENERLAKQFEVLHDHFDTATYGCPNCGVHTTCNDMVAENQMLRTINITMTEKANRLQFDLEAMLSNRTYWRERCARMEAAIIAAHGLVEAEAAEALYDRPLLRGRILALAARIGEIETLPGPR